MTDSSTSNDPVLRIYELVDCGLGIPEAYTVHLDGGEIGYMQVRRGCARAEYKGETIWDNGAEIDPGFTFAYFE